MKSILLLGAGRSATVLIKYLIKYVNQQNGELILADISLDLATEKSGGDPKVRPLALDVNDTTQRRAVISDSDIVISLLPASLHYLVAKDCVEIGRNMVTASYVSDEIADLNEEAQSKGIILMNEIGLDPGIDHLSAMKIIDDIKEKGGHVTSFKSYTGGLVAPESNDNPWNYKFTWNPRNVVLAGKGVAVYQENVEEVKVSYERLFSTLEKVNIPGYDMFEGYPNRDSLKYKSIYGLDDVKTMIRGTLRNEGFCEAWDICVQLNLTDEALLEKQPESYKDWLGQNLPNDFDSLDQWLAKYVSEGAAERFKWLNLDRSDAIPSDCNSNADILETVLLEKWKLNDNDIDMIVMQHQFVYEINGVEERLHSSLVVKGDNNQDTAMAKTVGLPVGIVTKHILEGNIKEVGVHIPTTRVFYEPLLAELENYGVEFREELA